MLGVVTVALRERGKRGRAGCSLFCGGLDGEGSHDERSC